MNCKKNPGFSVIEIMLSITVLTMVAIAILPVVGWMSVRAINYSLKNQAGLLAQEGTEAAVSVFYRNWDKNFKDYPEGIYHPVVIISSGEKAWELVKEEESELQTRFSRKIEIRKVCRIPESGMLSESGCDGSHVEDNRSKWVITTVWWRENNQIKTIENKLLLSGSPL